jgi:hypothetical protein
MAPGWLLELRLALGSGQVDYGQAGVHSVEGNCHRFWVKIWPKAVFAPPVGVGGMSCGKLAEG